LAINFPYPITTPQLPHALVTTHHTRYPLDIHYHTPVTKHHTLVTKHHTLAIKHHTQVTKQHTLAINTAPR
jgi:hypothetical protein